MASTVKRSITNVFLHPARMEPPAETLSMVMSASASLNMKVGWVLPLVF